VLKIVVIYVGKIEELAVNKKVRSERL